MLFTIYFGKYTMNQYPSAAKRKYAKIVPYRDYSIGLYRTDPNAPIFEIDGMPICEVYFALDEMGDNVLPVDAPLSSMLEAMAVINLYKRCDNDAWRCAHPNKPMWSFVQESIAAGRNCVDMLDFLREVQQRVIAFDPADDEFGDDPKAWKEETQKFMTDFLFQMSGNSRRTQYSDDGQIIEK